MSQPTKTIEFNGLKVEILTMPPPHLVFLASQVQSAPGEGAAVLSRAGGLAALCVYSIGGEVVEKPKLPRDLADLERLGAGFVMATYELVGCDYEALAGLFQAVLGGYEKGVANPT